MIPKESKVLLGTVVILGTSGKGGFLLEVKWLAIGTEAGCSVKFNVALDTVKGIWLG